MRGFGKSLAAAVTVLAVGAGLAWAQGEWTAPADAKNTKNPVKGVGGAKKSVETNCASCHGASGKGDGPAAVALQPKPADWTSAKVAKETDGELFWKISNGRGPMPPWKHLPDQERWEIVNYIRTLQKK
jgi:mono/diheme cytochrome c family protein